MRQTTKDEDFSCELLTGETIEEMAGLVSGEYVTDEPMYMVLGIQPAEYIPLARVFLPWCAHESLSFMARHRATGRGAGFVLATDLVHEPYGSLRDLCSATDSFWEKLAHERAFLDELEEPYLERERPGKGEILHVTALGVRKEYQGRGLATCLISTVLQHGEKKGFRRALADCTGPASLRAHEKCGFRPAGSLDYRSFTRNGEYPFAALQGSCLLVEKILGTSRPCPACGTWRR
jgi:GNAT superfamily N-acetyltransferase